VNIPDTELIYGNNCPYIDIQLEKGRIFVSNAVFRLIGNPSKVRLLWNAAKCMLLIMPTNVGDPDGLFVIGQPSVQHPSMCINSVTFVHRIWSMKWNKTLRFRITARYNEPTNVAIFEMKNAVASEIPRNIHDGRVKRGKSKLTDNIE